MSTPLEIEKHAADIYTMKMFYEFQGELCAACFSCVVRKSRLSGDTEITTILVSNRRRPYGVTFNCDTEVTTCSCKMFERIGMVCKHVLCMWKSKCNMWLADGQKMQLKTELMTCVVTFCRSAGSWTQERMF